jgi:hypothetical protein
MAPSAQFRLLRFSLATAFLLLLMAAFHRRVDLAHILITFAVALRTLLTAS